MDRQGEAEQVERAALKGGNKQKEWSELLAHLAVTVCGLTAVLAVASITIYMIRNGLPALRELGPAEVLFGTEWRPAAGEPSYGIFYIILTSLAGTGMAVLLGVPVGVLTAVYLSEFAPPKAAALVRPAIELLAGIPSVIYGLLGVMILNPLVYRLELWIFRDSAEHQFTGGANLISAVLVLAVMILPTVIHISEQSLRAVPAQLRAGAAALGATPIQAVYTVLLPAARSGIITAIVLGVGRAIGEAMAISLVSGSVVNLPLPFHSVRFLTTAIVSEMGYATDRHRQVLFTIGLVLFVFIMGINLMLTRTLKKRQEV